MVAVVVDVYVGTIHAYIYTAYRKSPAQLHTPAQGRRKDATRRETPPVAAAPFYSLGNLKSMVMIIRTIGPR